MSVQKAPVRPVLRVCVLCLPLAAAVVLLGVPHPRTIPASGFRGRALTLRLGMTPRQVEARLGPPTERHDTSRGQEWYYRRLQGTFVVEFARGRVERMMFLPT